MNLIYKNFIALTYEEHINILKIRNSEYVRLNMKSNDLISTENHLNWAEGLKFDKKNIYYAVMQENIIVGAIYITTIDYYSKSCTWGLYFKEKINPFISAISAHLIIDKVFNELSIKRLNLEVNKSNISAYNFDLSFGFKIYDEIKESSADYHLMFMSKDDWIKNKSRGLRKSVEKRIKKINYSFIEKEK